MKIGYARVSTQDQNLDMQIDALKNAGCEIVFEEKISGKSKERPELTKLFEKLRKGDTVVVWKLDRLGRSLKDLIDLITKMQQLEVSFLSIQDGINTNTATGRFTFNIFASLAEFEREIISERTKAGLSSARARGRKGGRPAGYSKETIKKIKAVKTLYNAMNSPSVQDIAESLKISRATCYRYLKVKESIK
ncbi:recombinase family protein [Sphingobacterium oryzagri]|uniref:Recombinase family protein n=1 Tax=Sphingobacterium oryzagri TaxID=3025669 RepID=A0ABY7WBV8_9SPHI|nr:recombinase family protein [Sphingobacterium sp. KACC 22765]WDF67147.1 recombinase family protein [Sphingobacterium sp. KACC 22765]